MISPFWTNAAAYYHRVRATPDPGPAPTLPKCRRCGKANDSDRRNCPACRQRLRVYDRRWKDKIRLEEWRAALARKDKPS